MDRVLKRGDVWRHVHRTDIAGNEMSEDRGNRPILLVSTEPVHKHDLMIALYKNSAVRPNTTRFFLVEGVSPKRYPDSEWDDVHAGPIDAQQPWTVPKNRLLRAGPMGHLESADVERVDRKLDELLRPPRRYPKDLSSGAPTVGAVVWYRIHMKSDHDAEALRVEFAAHGVEWSPSTQPIACLVLLTSETTERQRRDGPAFPLVTLVPLLRSPTLETQPGAKNITAPDCAGETATPQLLAAVTTVVFTVDWRARIGTSLRCRFSGWSSWIVSESEYMAVLNDVRRHMALLPV